MQLLLIGFNSGVLGALEKVWPNGQVTVLEEPDLWENKNLTTKAERFSCIGEVILGHYQQSTGFLDSLEGRGPFTAVAPGLEYALEAAAMAAERLGLPGTGIDSAEVLRDKLKMRERTSQHGVPGPRFAEVSSAAELAEFADGHACVLKPANRQASLGVVLLDPGDSAEEAWAECIGADEGVQIADRDMHWQYLAEERMTGPEHSTECLVRDGEILFLNITEKETLPGPHPVEVAHVVPAPGEDQHWWRQAVDAVVKCLGFGTGILHTEWIVVDGVPHIVESAGRPSGDRIIDLIDLAHGTDLTERWIRLLAGEDMDPVSEPSQGAAIRFLLPPPGVVREVEGVSRAEAAEGIEQVDVTVAAETAVGAITSSWHRGGSVIATGSDGTEALERARAAVRLITFDTSDE